LKEMEGLAEELILPGGQQGQQSNGGGEANGEANGQGQQMDTVV